MQKITPCLWFHDDAEEAVHFYLTVFRNARINEVACYGPAAAEVSGRPEGSVMTISFELEGQRFVALNGGPLFDFSPAISFMVDCADQRDVDELWAKLSAGGATEQCGWLRDKFGVSWQIVPTPLEALLHDPDLGRSERVMRALLKQDKPNVAALQQAYEG